MSSELLLGKDKQFSFLFTIYPLHTRAQEAGPQDLEMSGKRSILRFLKLCCYQFSGLLLAWEKNRALGLEIKKNKKKSFFAEYTLTGHSYRYLKISK